MSDLFNPDDQAPKPAGKAITLRQYIKLLQELGDSAPQMLELPVMKWLPSSGAIYAQPPVLGHLLVVRVGDVKKVNFPTFWHSSDGGGRMGPPVIKI